MAVRQARQTVAKVFAGGSKCSASGKRYEQVVNNACRLLARREAAAGATAVPLSTMEPSELGGCTGKHDLQINWHGVRDVNVEVKKQTPDWVQTSIVPAAMPQAGGLRRSPRLNNLQEINSLTWLSKARGPTSDIFDDLLYGKTVYNSVPSFLSDAGNRLFVDWEKERAAFPDVYIECDDDVIAKAYCAKGAHYIQLYGFGLYHTGRDVCGFGVPLFECKQRLRIRCKRHGRRCKQSGRYVPSSVTASFRPIYKTLKKSSMSLDNARSMAQAGILQLL